MRPDASTTTAVGCSNGPNEDGGVIALHEASVQGADGDAVPSVSAT